MGAPVVTPASAYWQVEELIPHQLDFRTEPYRLLLIQDQDKCTLDRSTCPSFGEAQQAGQARPAGTEARSPLSLNSSSLTSSLQEQQGPALHACARRLQQCFNLDTFIILEPTSYSGRILNEQASMLAALRQARPAAPGRLWGVACCVSVVLSPANASSVSVKRLFTPE